MPTKCQRIRITELTCFFFSARVEYFQCNDKPNLLVNIFCIEFRLIRGKQKGGWENNLLIILGKIIITKTFCFSLNIKLFNVTSRQRIGIGVCAPQNHCKTTRKALVLHTKLFIQSHFEEQNDEIKPESFWHLFSIIITRLLF